LKSARANHVGALADDQRARAFVGLDQSRCRNSTARCASAGTRAAFCFRHLRDGANVLIRGAAAAADNIEPAVIDEFFELRGQRFGRLQDSGSSFGKPAFG
jgi:hypothetical protein